jgi:hypothetical protein
MRTGITGTRGQRLIAAGLLVPAATVGLVWIGASHAAGAGRSAAPVFARAAHVVSAADTAYLHMVGESGSLIAEEGSATGGFPGRVKARFGIGATVTASFTIYPRGGGSISGHGSATLHSSGAYATFGGTMSVTHGSGRYAHAHGTGGLYGAINRRTYALTVQTTGKLYY